MYINYIIQSQLGLWQGCQRHVTVGFLENAAIPGALKTIVLLLLKFHYCYYQYILRKSLEILIKIYIQG